MNSTTSTQQTHGERLETEVNIFIMKPSPLKWSQLHTKSGHLWEVSTVACDLEKKNKTHEQMSDINRQTVNFQRLLQSYSNTTSNTSNDRLLTSNGSNLPKPKFQLATCNPWPGSLQEQMPFSALISQEARKRASSILRWELQWFLWCHCYVRIAFSQ